MASNLSNSPFSLLANALIKAFEEKQETTSDKKISVNILVTKVASYYEKLRTSMDYGNEETILRRAIERNLKRRLFLDTDAKSLAHDLVREIIWAGYFKDDSVPESIIKKVSDSIRLHLELKEKVTKLKLTQGIDINEFIIQILSCEIYTILAPNNPREAMANFMFQVLKDSVEITDDSKQTKDVQVFIAIRKNFARDDIAFLRYKLFVQIFGRLTDTNLNQTVSGFPEGLNEIICQLSYPRKDRIFNHIKKKTPPFLILYDLLRQEKDNLGKLIKDQESFKSIIYAICNTRYKGIKNKVKTAIIRSFIFILFTKAFIALSIEGTFERIFYGNVQWGSIALNTIVPPVLMVIAGMRIKTPDNKNSHAIYLDIYKLLLEENPNITESISLKLKSNTATIKDYVFSLLWFLSIILIFGAISAILGRLHFNPLSQAIFLFFIAIISFLSYRIYQTASAYTVIFKKDLLTPILDFFFVPVIRVGRKFTEGIAQVNFILIIIDYIIETPFKGLVGFFEQWFSYLAAKREELE
ncbi:MAG: hypothetical protein AAB702_00730, partial [Patescibacteria group bacterium]